MMKSPKNKRILSFNRIFKKNKIKTTLCLIYLKIYKMRYHLNKKTWWEYQWIDFFRIIEKTQVIHNKYCIPVSNTITIIMSIHLILQIKSISVIWFLKGLEIIIKAKKIKLNFKIMIGMIKIHLSIHHLNHHF